MSEIGFVSARVEKHLKRDLYLIGLKRSSLFPKGRFFYEEELQKGMKEDNIFCIESILRKKKRGRDIFLPVK